MKYDLILQNNASRKFSLYPGLEDVSTSHLYHLFEDVELDEPDGEHTYVLLHNDRDDVEYEFKTPLLDTIVRVPGYEDILLRDLQPSTGLLRIGDTIAPANIYDNNETSTIFYYE